MRGAIAREPAGFSLFEFAVVASVLAVLAGVLLMRIAYYQEQAERVAVEQVVGTLRTALALRTSGLAQRKDRRALLRVAEENPFDWLARKPANYLGEYYGPELEKMPEGNWVFDRRDKCLIYLLNSHRSFYFKASNFLKFKVEFAELPTRSVELARRPAEVVGSVELVQVSGVSATEP